MIKSATSTCIQSANLLFQWSVVVFLTLFSGLLSVFYLSLLQKFSVTSIPLGLPDYPRLSSSVTRGERHLFTRMHFVSLQSYPTYSIRVNDECISGIYHT